MARLIQWMRNCLEFIAEAFQSIAEDDIAGD
jgi:hypothetical protein